MNTLLAVLFLSTSSPLCSTAAEQSLRWLAGQWCSESGERQVQELWLPSEGADLIGLGRTLAAGHQSSFEFLRIGIEDGQLIYFAQPGGRATTQFRCRARGADWIRFENPEHDFPRVIEYRRNGDELHAEISGPTAEGTERRIPFTFQRCNQALLP